MKRFIALLTVITFALFSVKSFAEELIDFPFFLNEGKYEIVIPKNETWTIFNNEAIDALKIKYAQLKIDIETNKELCDTQLTSLETACEIKLQNALDVKQLAIDDLNTENARLQKLVKSDTFLGIKKSVWFFALGVITAYGTIYLASMAAQ